MTLYSPICPNGCRAAATSWMLDVLNKPLRLLVRHSRPGTKQMSSPRRCYNPRAGESFPAMFPSPASGSCLAIFKEPRLLVPALPLRSRWYKWNVVIEEKVQIGSSCKWSLVSGRRFLFRLCSQTGVWSFKGENHTSVTSGLSDPLTFSLRAGVWVTHYKTELSRPSLSSLPTSQRHNFNSQMCRVWLSSLFSTRAQNCLCFELPQNGSSQILNNLGSMMPLLRSGAKRSRKRETNPEMRQLPGGPKVHFISFQKEVHVCRLLL